jgi:hypothetical protein
MIISMGKNIFVDIDDTICETDGMNYSESNPIMKNITFVNKLFEEGHRITYWTARGTKTGTDHRKLTEEQLKIWGAKYHELRLQKPAYDILIDDKAINNISEARLLCNIFSDIVN